MELMGTVSSRLSEAECYAADGQREVAYGKMAKLKKLGKDRYVSPYQLALPIVSLRIAKRPLPHCRSQRR